MAGAKQSAFFRLLKRVAPAAEMAGERYMDELRKGQRSFSDVKKICDDTKKQREKERDIESALCWELTKRYVETQWGKEQEAKKKAAKAAVKKKP